jgi:cytoplasmic iron level regulating protein YaaA (DUF328/UPF0246 family)
VDVSGAPTASSTRDGVGQDAPMPRPLAILLPPSEGKAPGGVEPGWDPSSGRFGERLADHRRAVAGALATARGGDERLLEARGETLERARAANRALIGAPCLPAAERFTGVVWEHLDLPGLRRSARTKALDAVVVVSALAGLVALDDPLPDHRVKLSASLPRLGKLATYWREDLSATLNDHLDGRLVIDLLPKEHAAAWTPDPDRYELRRVELRTRDGKPGGHVAKAAKGRLARALIEARSPAATLSRWHDDVHVLVVDGRAADGTGTTDPRDPSRST